MSLTPEQEQEFIAWSLHMGKCKDCDEGTKELQAEMQTNPQPMPTTYEDQKAFVHKWIKKMCPDSKRMAAELFPLFIAEFKSES